MLVHIQRLGFFRWAKFETHMTAVNRILEFSKHNEETRDGNSAANWPKTDIATLPLDFIRKNISIVHQNPFLFTGTIRENIDPLGRYADEQVWNIIKTINLEKLFCNLEHKISGVDCNLSYFFWGYVLTQIPEGRLSETFGSKIIIGIGVLTASLLTILTPISSYMNYYCLLFVRFALGIALGIHWPSMPPMAIKWVSPTDMSKFLSHMTASSLGVAVTLPMCGYLIDYWGWPSVFYVTGLMGLATPGILANSADIAPAYSGTIYGISQVPAGLAGYALTKIVAVITKDEQSFQQWTYVFWILAGVNLFAFLFCLIFTSGDEQSWNHSTDDAEMEKLQNDGSKESLRNATMAIGRSRRPRGPTYARGANRSQFEDPELAVNARHLATRRAHPAFKFFTSLIPEAESFNLESFVPATTGGLEEHMLPPQMSG
ncbi:hypothetical protein GEV33_002053 [Tenebrio molitor]|uniref:Major facilitator superfamily (MFS) profile domain-containing protein n=1 Tax=Tenebrio molitor TaxID=7067 RepID=A0A8J6HV52_TENMO|nr:hypothetical protein GEV33_002053 [Tenebrio molitor]